MCWRCVSTNMADSKVLLIRESSRCPLVWPHRIGCQKYRFFADVRVCWGDKMNPSLLPHCFSVFSAFFCDLQAALAHCDISLVLGEV